MTLIPQPGILDIAPYVGGESAAPGANRVVRLASNENPLGASPKAVVAYREVADHLHRYPDGGSDELRQAIAESEGLDPARIVCGAGSDELISLLVRAYAGVGDEVLHSAHGFLMYSISARTVGALPVAAPERSLRSDPAALLERVGPRTRLLFIANPNNPTGSYLTSAELRALHAALPRRVLLVVDAAYAEYVDETDYEDGSALVEAFDNVVMTRTFSKIHGLAALRLGWAYCSPAVADVLHRLRGPFNVAAPAQAAGAAAVRDRDFVSRSATHNRSQRATTTQALTRQGLTVYPSAGNFILVRFPEEPARGALAALAHCKSQGILLRQMTAYGLPDCLRITIGTEEEMRSVVQSLAELMG